MHEEFEYNNKNNHIFFLILKILLIFFIYFLLLNISYYKNLLLDINNQSIHNGINQIQNKLRVCICTLGKKENNYIREYIRHYYQYGVDKIYLYDNNDIDGEKFETVISDYIEKKYVEIFNYRGKNAPQFKIFKNCYKNIYKMYDWLIFYDLDEYIHLENYSNIKDFLNKTIFKKCKAIYLNCMRHTDNNLIYYDNRPLAQRFPEINWNSKMYTVKTIMRGNLKGIKFKTSHWLDRRIKGCDINGKMVIPSKKVKLNNSLITSNFKKYYIDHYCFKSTEEYINKLNKGDGIFGYNNSIRMHKINLYFNYNKLTLEKINFIEKRCKFNLTKFRIKLKNN